MKITLSGIKFDLNNPKNKVRLKFKNNVMKKLMYGLVLGSVFTLSSCGPSFCDCMENKNKENSDPEISKECVDKYEDLHPMEKMQKMNDCKN